MAPDMISDELRDRIFEQHQELRLHVYDAECAALLARSGDARWSATLRANVRNLCEALLTHLAFEESALLGSLGVAEAEHLAAEHEAQRAAAKTLVELSISGDGSRLSEATRAMCHDLATDMRTEEHALFAPGPLKAEAAR
jgi:hypothetical protein